MMTRAAWRTAPPNASQLSNFSRDTLCSSCRAREAAFGCEAVVKSVIAVRQADRVSWTHDCYAAERRLAGSAAATDRITA
ncbi:hypothetical protein J2X87_003848 [Pseudomonas synxantha]|uniref:Uncharacterized protein n=1 Tax=Pseudomonas synxantha TaxID=47883 RepID=A0ACC6JR49_9PSED|nr:hypothetical protein [Pseudomonas synxantha]